MPISDQALAGLRSAVKWNPHGAKELLAILREFPAHVKYEDDLYGPLGILLLTSSHRQQITKGISVPVKSKPLSDDNLATLKVFVAEWNQRHLTKQELADVIEAILAELDIQF